MPWRGDEYTKYKLYPSVGSEVRDRFRDIGVGCSNSSRQPPKQKIDSGCGSPKGGHKPVGAGSAVGTDTAAVSEHPSCRNRHEPPAQGAPKTSRVGTHTRAAPADRRW